MHKVNISDHLCSIIYGTLIICICFSQCKMSSGHNMVGDLKVDIDTSLIERFSIDCSIRAIEAIDELTMWFAGTNGMFGYTKDGGRSWYVDSLEHPDHEDLQFRSIAVTTQSVFLLSIGSPALMYRSDDWGDNWEIVYQEDDQLAFYDAMVFWDDKEGIAMGDPTSGCLSVIKTTDGGKTWQKLSCDKLPSSFEGEAAFAASNTNIALYKNNVWIVSGGSKARVFKSTDRGLTWEVYQTPIVQGGQMTGIYSIDFFDDLNGIIIGGDWNDKQKNTSNKAITMDGGVTWTLVSDGLDPGYRSCVGYLGSSSPDLIMAVGIPGISLTRDRGMNWELISDESFYTFRIADQAIWLAGKNIIAKVPLRVN